MSFILFKMNLNITQKQLSKSLGNCNAASKVMGFLNYWGEVTGTILRGEVTIIEQI
jgi:hypothetical protein